MFSEVVCLKNRKIIIAIILAILAAVFYSISTPASKMILSQVSPTFMAAFLYLGAGIGVGIMYLFHYKKEPKTTRISKGDYLYVIGMVALDIVAPILMMIGINKGSSSSASLLGNFEIVATSLIALLIFKELISKKLWLAIILISIASAVLSFEGTGEFKLSLGSIFVILATLCWGLENNCTRKISSKSTYQIVTIKGLCSGAGSLIIALFLGDAFPKWNIIVLILLLGFVAYGLSIFMYVRAQKDLGAAKTSALYSIAPFFGTFLAFVFVGDKLTWFFAISLLIMIAGTILVILDTLSVNSTPVPLNNKENKKS